MSNAFAERIALFHGTKQMHPIVASLQNCGRLETVKTLPQARDLLDRARELARARDEVGDLNDPNVIEIQSPKWIAAILTGDFMRFILDRYSVPLLHASLCMRIEGGPLSGISWNEFRIENTHVRVVTHSVLFSLTEPVVLMVDMSDFHGPNLEIGTPARHYGWTLDH